MSVPHLFYDLLVVPAQDSGIPRPTPQTPPGSEALLWIAGGVMWLAGLGAVGLFFGGIIKASIGRVTEHHSSGRQGANWMIGALFLALLWGMGYGLITQMAEAGVQG